MYCLTLLRNAREAAKRVLNEFPYRVQVLGGVLLHEGDIAEMRLVKVRH